jgi:hypothetical protein
MSIRVLAAEPLVLTMRTRMPFRYGIVTVAALPHLFLKVDVEVDGRRQVGLAADNLAPKWFTKNPDSPVADDVAEMIAVIDQACTIARAVPKQPTVFAFWKYLYEMQSAWAGGWGKPPLLAHLGTSLVERAVIDAFCKARNVPFHKAVRHNTLGLDLGVVQPELAGTEPKDWLPTEPLREIMARHTVGMIDPLTDAEVSPAERLDDGLPQSLEACIRAYGLTRFKIKLWGEAGKDVDRVRRVAEVIERNVASGQTADRPYGYTFDANENFADVGAYRAFWERLTAEPALAGFLRRLVFVEQPMHRAAAMTPAVGAAFAAWPDRPPTVIDESDGAVDTARQALALGYVGTSHKNCKGVIKGLVNTCLIASRKKADPAGRYHISGEDLSNVGPIALLQDLAVVSALGIADVERNGHHYFRGLTALPPDVQATVAEAHPDLYRRTPAGFPAVRIEAGKVRVGTVVDAPFGTAFEFDPSQFTPAKDWTWADR